MPTHDIMSLQKSFCKGKVLCFPRWMSSDFCTRGSSAAENYIECPTPKPINSTLLLGGSSCLWTLKPKWTFCFTLKTQTQSNSAKVSWVDRRSLFRTWLDTGKLTPGVIWLMQLQLQQRLKYILLPLKSSMRRGKSPQRASQIVGFKNWPRSIQLK